MPTSIAEKSTHQTYLDGIRGFSILLVLLSHTAYFLQHTLGINYFFSGMESFVGAGNQGVKLFFLVSAFTLFASSSQRFSTEKRPWRNFYIRRFFRIFPFFWIMVTLYTLFTQNWQGFLPSAGMYFGFLRFDPRVEATHVQWSLFVEECFYLTLPLMFARLQTLRGALYFFVGSFFVSYLWVNYASAFGIPNTNTFIDFFPLSQWYCFALGIVLYYLYSHPVFFARVLNNRSWAPLLSVAATILGLQLIRQIAPYSTFGLMMIFIAAMHPHSLYGKMARSRFLGNFGITCYSIYLIHPLLLQLVHPAIHQLVMVGALRDLPMEIVLLVLFPTFAYLCLSVARFSFTYLEKPFVRMGKKIIERLENTQEIRQTREVRTAA